ncbi:MAG: hypothetical protein ACXWNS_00500, partial [Isosphaeraceae bacterium]
MDQNPCETSHFLAIGVLTQRCSTSFWLDFRILLATVPHVFRVPPETIARVFGFPRISSQRAEESSAATEASFLIAPVQPH